MAISKRLRFEILRRDGFKCQYCGRAGSEGDAHLRVDHVIATTLGGSDEPNNLITACHDCNAGKSSVAADSATVQAVSAAALRWEAAQRQVAEQRSADRALKAGYQDTFLEAWNVWRQADGKCVPLPSTWRRSLNTFMENSLDEDELEEIVVIAMNRPNVPGHERFKYMCGVAWNRVKEIQEEILAALESE